jgi:hypothetical protein
MKYFAILGLALSLGLASCGGSDERLEARIHELQDSLKASRDSIRDFQRMGWCFSSVSSVVKLSKYDLYLGDTLGIDVFLAAGNDDHSFYSTHPILEVGEGVKPISIEQAGNVGWRVHFVPTRMGADSITGTLLVPNQGDLTDTVKLPFAAYYTVGIPQDAPFTP